MDRTTAAISGKPQTASQMWEDAHGLYIANTHLIVTLHVT